MSWSTEFVELNQKLHDRESFDCGKEELNDFIQTKAAKHALGGVSRTYVLPGTAPLKNGKTPICSFYSLCPHYIDRKTLPEEFAKKLPHDPIPTILIGQLAVDVNCKGRGLGAITLIIALKLAQAASDKIGGFAVIVDCLDADAESFYLQYGFLELQRVNGKMRMFLPMKTIRAIPD